MKTVDPKDRMRMMNRAGFAAKRVTRRYRQSIKASPDIVFPLVCPVREAEWLDGWRHSMLFSRSGLVEEGAVFTTPGEHEPPTVWIVTVHDNVRREVEFTRFTPDSRVCVLRIAVTADGEGRSAVDISYCYTSISEAGNAFLDGFTEQAFLEAVTFWERAMNHWLESGKRLTRPA
jgi:hypothetical protein